ncbi:hypothetical protein CCYN2B_130011 [Capnocytophaga cynodegmi]|uniref:Uncharacterized protein n=1 Tax=Capnocytophaga cynodegmi TaxID=28189 RepID=A0A0B7H5S2_9FLAO|nr:hypothetical protein CCYN2B_130011 [Capnocytophaga cynodegmi]
MEQLKLLPFVKCQEQLGLNVSSLSICLLFKKLKLIKEEKLDVLESITSEDLLVKKLVLKKLDNTYYKNNAKSKNKILLFFVI